jgi:fission 1 protein
VLKTQFDKEEDAGFASIQTRFNYAWGLIKSKRRSDNLEGVRHLTGMKATCEALSNGPFRVLQFPFSRAILISEIYKMDPSRRRESLYYLALGHYKLASYTEARRFNDLLLEKEPHNLQAISLRGLIDDNVAKGMCC